MIYTRIMYTCIIMPTYTIILGISSSIIFQLNSWKSKHKWMVVWSLFVIIDQQSNDMLNLWHCNVFLSVQFLKMDTCTYIIPKKIDLKIV